MVVVHQLAPLYVASLSITMIRFPFLAERLLIKLHRFIYGDRMQPALCDHETMFEGG